VGASPLRRLAACGLALALAGGAFVLLGLLLAGTAAPPPAPRNPFGTGIREVAPAATGLGGWLLAVQASFHRSLVAALGAIRREDAAAWPLLLFGFAYGVFHAAGPGHGKGVIASYIVASRKTLALVALGLVGILAILLDAGAAAVSAAASRIELASFAALAVFGLVLLWRKSAAVAGGAGAECGPACDHGGAVLAAEASRATTLRDSLAVIAAAGLRPCSGAIILLVFALSQGLFWTGAAAVLAMAAGTALTTGALAAIAVGAKHLALRLAGGRGAGGARALAWLELAAAAFATVLGAALLLGLWSAGGGA
jgi:nickel/cobalt exporter